MTLTSEAVDFSLSDDELALQTAAGGLLDDLASPAAVRAHLATGAGYDRRLWDAMVGQGWLDVLDYGFVAAAVLMEQIGAHVAPAPFHQTLLARSALPPTHPLATAAVGCVAWDRGAGRLLVPYAPVADVAVVASADRIVVHDLRSGARPAAETAMDLTRCVGWLDGDGGETIGGPAEATALVDRAVVAAAAESLGACDRVLAMTVEHAKSREQFGRPIGSFQAVKHRCADMLVDLEGMRSTVYHAAWSIAAGDPDASIAASTAQVWCADASARIMASGLQVHGGIGFTWEHDLHLYLKRAQLDRVTFGDAPVHRERLAALLRPRVEAGEPVV